MKNISLIPALFLALASFSTLNAQDSTPTFQDFLAQFSKVELPYSFSAATLQANLEARPITKAGRLDWSYYHFLPQLEQSAEFSSMPVHPEPLASFETEKHFAVVYNLARGLARGNKSYNISVYTKEGIHVGTHFVAGINPETLTTSTIDKSLNANVIEYKISWEKNYRENGYKDNAITGITLTETGVFGLATAGNPDQIEWANCVELENSPLVKLK